MAAKERADAERCGVIAFGVLKLGLAGDFPLPNCELSSNVVNRDLV